MDGQKDATEPKLELNNQEIKTLIQVLDATPTQNLNTAQMLIALKKKLQIMGDQLC